jgi:hypothetical protein
MLWICFDQDTDEIGREWACDLLQGIAQQRPKGVAAYRVVICVRETRRRLEVGTLRKVATIFVITIISTIAIITIATIIIIIATTTTIIIGIPAATKREHERCHIIYWRKFWST